MSKRSKYYDDDYGYDNYNERNYNSELKERRRMKKMKSALRTKDLDLLYDMDDD